MPSSQQDRPTVDYEPIFLFTKSASYFFDIEAGKERGTVSSEQRRKYLRHGAGTKGGSTDSQYAVQGDYSQGEKSGTRSPRTVWRLKPEPSNYDYCLACETIYIGGDRKGIKEFCGACGERWPRKKRSAKACPACGDEEKPRQRECPTCKSRKDWISHYAAFPSSLPRRCIAMGTSERGECPSCGKPWARVIERGELVPDAPGYTPRGRDRPEPLVKTAMTPAGSKKGHPNFHYEQTMVGWVAQCECAAGDPVPQTILDICLGTGTTAIVAVQMGRRAVGIELSPSYAKLAAERIRILGSRKAKAAPRAAMPLFQKTPDG